MHRFKRNAVIATAAAAVVAAVSGVTYQASAAEGVQPPDGLKLIGMFVVGDGTQTYTCGGGKFADPSVPEAGLYDGANRKIHHFGGPSWQSEADGSLITAAKLTSSPVPGAIPELLLEVTTHSGQGMLGTVTHIQRMNTAGGLPPATPCTDGEKASVPYKANYLFWGN